MCTAQRRAVAVMARRIEAGSAKRRRERGAALMMVLIAVALIALATLMPLRNERLALQRERERELLFVGDQYRLAIASYAAATPAGAPRFPKSLSDLLEDPRFPGVRRHLRRLYADPMTGAADWSLLREQGAIVGLASRSTRAPLKRSGFAAGDADFADAATYADWKFVPRNAPNEAVAAAVASAASASAPVQLSSASPAGDRRRLCLRAYSAALNRCALVPGGSGPCREHAKEALLACLKEG